MQEQRRSEIMATRMQDSRAILDEVERGIAGRDAEREATISRALDAYAQVLPVRARDYLGKPPFCASLSQQAVSWPLSTVMPGTGST